MIVKDAKDAARQWVSQAGGTLPGFQGAFFHGSTSWQPDDADLPATSDVDVIVVLAESSPPVKLGKFRYRDVILDVSSLSSEQLRSPGLVLGQYHLAGSLRTAGIIADPSGRLTELQAGVSKDFAKRPWVHRRCEDARGRVLRHLQAWNEAERWHDQVTAWLFAAGVLTHVLLVAGFRNPTVRRRYVDVRDLLVAYGHADCYEPLLDVLGCAAMCRAAAERHLAALAEAFDAAQAVIRSPFSFASDISDLARPIAIDGSRDLIERGSHREAMFWIVATSSRCQTVLSHDAPAEMRERFVPGYRRLLGDLGIGGPADLRQRTAQVKDYLPRVWTVAEAIMAANPGIDDQRC